MGQKAPDAAISAVKPCTVETGSSRPFRTHSSKLPRRFEHVTVAGADVESCTGLFAALPSLSLARVSRE